MIRNAKKNVDACRVKNHTINYYLNINFTIARSSSEGVGEEEKSIKKILR
jgi:hypothetical protein